VWTEEDVTSLWTESARYEPAMGDDERQSLLADWRRALQRSGRWVTAD
jgi:glycerol kinase